MARDATAYSVQGPDTAGNPFQIQTTAGNNLLTDIEQIAAVAVATATAGVMRVGLTDAIGTQVLAVATGDLANYLQVALQGGVPTNVTAAANTAIAQTVAGIAGRRVRVMSCSFYYIGANATGIFTIADGATTVFRFDFPASQNTLLQITMPVGGIISSAGNGVTFNLPAGGAGTNAVLNYSVLQW